MDHSENDRRFCVYQFRDVLNGIIFYVGQGSKNRPYVKGNRGSLVSEYISKNKFSIEIVVDNISKQDAVRIESDILNKYLNDPKDGYNLLNINNGNGTKPLLYSEISKYFCYDETSPTYLRRCRDITGTGGALLRRAGDVAGTVGDNKNGRKRYSSVCLNRQMYQVHRLIYCICHKVDVPINLVIDHIDGNHLNNDIDNLRLVTQSENMKSAIRCEKQANNSSGVNGVYYLKTDYNEYWVASISYEIKKRKTKNFNIEKLGNDRAFEMAIEWRKQMEELYCK